MYGWVIGGKRLVSVSLGAPHLHLHTHTHTYIPVETCPLPRVVRENTGHLAKFEFKSTTKNYIKYQIYLHLLNLATLPYKHPLSVVLKLTCSISKELIIKFSGSLQSGWHQGVGLKLARVGILTPKKLEKFKKQGFSLWKAGCWAMYQITISSPE